jgi:tol-pal system protein YbgF
MKRLFPIFVVLAAVSVTAPAHAGLFDDDEARRAILDIRTKVDSLALVSGQLEDKLTTKADKTVVLDLLNQQDQLRQDIAKLRGDIEVLSNDVSDNQRRQKEFYVDLDNRLRKLEPQKITLDGKEAQVDPDEQKKYDAAQSLFQSGDYKNAAGALSGFLQSYPRSIYVAGAQYALGIAYYAQKDYKNAISSFGIIVADFPDNAKAPDAMLNIASCYSEQKDKSATKKILLKLRSLYPNSTAAATAGDRLKAVK